MKEHQQLANGTRMVHLQHACGMCLAFQEKVQWLRLVVGELLVGHYPNPFSIYSILPHRQEKERTEASLCCYSDSTYISSHTWKLGRAEAPLSFTSAGTADILLAAVTFVP